MHDHDSFGLVSPRAFENPMEAWRTRSLELRYPYVYLDRLELKRRWDGHIQTLSFMVAVGVSELGEREPIAVELASLVACSTAWTGFLDRLRRRGLWDVQLFISDHHPGIASATALLYPKARWQLCMKHFNHGVLGVVSAQERRTVACALQIIHAQPCRVAAEAQARECLGFLQTREQHEAARSFQADVDRTLAFYAFPKHHWQRLRTNASLETTLRCVRHRTIVDGTWADSKLALLLVCAQLRRRYRRAPDLRWRRALYLDMHQQRK